MFPAQAMPTDNEVESDLPTSSSDQVQVWDKGAVVQVGNENLKTEAKKAFNTTSSNN